MSLRVARYTGPSADWDALVRRSPGWTHFHLHGWRDVMTESFGHRCPYLGAWTEAGALVGVLPLVRVSSLVFGRFLVSMPFLNYGGPLGSDEAVRALAGEAVREAREQRAGLLELRSRISLPLDLPVSHRKITVVLDLAPGEPDKVFGTFKAKLRSQIRKPEKEGVSVRIGADQVAPFYEVFSRHMRDLGTPVLSRRFFENIAAKFSEDAWFGCAYKDGMPVACGAGFVWNGEFEMTWASALTAWQKLAPNMALYWAFIERATTLGLRLFNFGRCTPDSGTHRFKLQWGSRDEPLFWYQSASGKSATPSPDDGAYSLGPKVWKHLPLPLANLLGPWIVRSIP
ncbi:MAG TPA: FemAB family XrtA/PEP-CTERM system-associated protein [Gemmatimonadales bacterium]|jgi:FemAB-related protein (PEP-CTERM system-associated)